jgi:hypothetical protein
MASRSALPVLLLAALAAVFVFAYSTRSAASAQGSNQTPIAAELPPPPVIPSEKPDPKPKSRLRRGIHRIAVVRGSVPLRERPNGRMVARAGASTEFGGRRVMSIAARRGPWLGVVATELPNGRLAWVHRRNAGLDFRRTAYSLHADLSSRRLELRRRGRPIRRIAVAIGRPGSETPTGRFAVTDKLSGSRFGPYYGCCILALTGKQPKLPPGWQGGNRLAIHGTDSPGTIGAAASAGCLRAGDADLQALMRRVPLGAPVFVRN